MFPPLDALQIMSAVLVLVEAFGAVHYPSDFLNICWCCFAFVACSAGICSSFGMVFLFHKLFSGCICAIHVSMGSFGRQISILLDYVVGCCAGRFSFSCVVFRLCLMVFMYVPSAM